MDMSKESFENMSAEREDHVTDEISDRADMYRVKLYDLRTPIDLDESLKAAPRDSSFIRIVRMDHVRPEAAPPKKTISNRSTILARKLK